MPCSCGSTTPEGDGEFENRHFLEYTGLPLRPTVAEWESLLHPEDPREDVNGLAPLGRNRTISTKSSIA